MSYGPAKSATYVNRRSWDELHVDRLTSAREVGEVSPQLCGLILRAYTHAYEKGESNNPSGRLPRGTIATRYSIANHARFRERAIEHYERGSQFWVIRADNGDITAFAKVTPGEVLEDPRPGTVYINDVATDPGDQWRANHQRRGYGRAALHAALTFGDFADVPVWLEAFEASEDQMVGGYLVPGRNQLYRNMGLERIGGVDPFTFHNDAELWMCEFGTPNGMTLNGVIGALEIRYPDLRQASARY